jgi:hypothetical protein
MFPLCRELRRHFKLQKFFNVVQDLYFGRNLSAYGLLLKRNWCESVADKNNMATLETLNFDNLVLRSLPIDPIKQNFVRQVPNACFSLVDPTAVKDPEVVVHSESAMGLLDLTQEQVERAEFAEYFSGNTKLPGSQTAAHCYCGHQFGSFAGQLGDGAAMYVFDIQIMVSLYALVYMYESIPTAIIPPRANPREFDFSKNIRSNFRRCGQNPLSNSQRCRQKHSQMPISASYVSHIILREENQLNFKCLFNFMIGSKLLVFQFI